MTEIKINDDVAIKTTPENWKRCPKCGIRHMNTEKFNGQDYCNKCVGKILEYEADSFRKKNDIRFKDEKDLTWYQQYQRRQYEEYKERLIKNDL